MHFAVSGRPGARWARRAESKRRAAQLAELHTVLDSLRRNEQEYSEAVDDFAVERLIYEHAALVCRCRSVLRELRGGG